MIRVLTVALLAGCAAAPDRPAPDRREVVRGLELMEARPKPLRRPVVVLSGFRSPSMATRALVEDIVDGTSGREEDVLLIAYPKTGDIGEAAREAVRRINERWPSPSPDRTVEVDVVGVSMGGLVARWGALTPEQRAVGRADDPEATESAAFPRLSIARLFTFATPHRGARMARMGFSPAARDMRPDSDFLRTLDANAPAYPLVCYAHLDDMMVGATRAAPPGVNPIWTPGTLVLNHYSTHRDPVLVADLIHRLRDEPPFLESAGPPPRD